MLVTGAGGFLGRHLVEVLGRNFSARPFDVQGESVIQGSVTDRAALESAMEGVTGLVIGHMAPNRDGIYDDPAVPFDINVKGAALCMQVAAELGVKRVVLISSTTVVGRDLAARRFLSRDLPPSPHGLYALTKTLQEAVARYYHEEHGLEVAMLRPAYVVSGDDLVDKYGNRKPGADWQAIDPRDIAEAARAALQLDGLGCEPFYLVAGPEAEAHADIAYTMERLGWQPRYRFDEFPRQDIRTVPGEETRSGESSGGFYRLNPKRVGNQ